jgi:serine protease
VVSVQVKPGTPIEHAEAVYRTSPLVDRVLPDHIAHALATPNDQYYPIQWHYPKIALSAAWDTVTGGPVIVAVVDTGIRADHPDLQGVTVAGYDFVDNDDDPTDPGCPTDPTDPSHGTHVAGTIAALTNNSTGVAGVAWGGSSAVRIMPVRVLGYDSASNTCGVGYYSQIAAGIRFAADNGAKVINLSLGGPYDSDILRDAVTYAVSKGAVVVAAAGNDAGPVLYPAAYPESIAVSAVACDDTLASYSNRGPQIWVAAPGGDITPACPDWPDYRGYVWSTGWSPASSNTYYGMQGTSMAAPHVSGVAALLFARGYSTPDAVRNRLRETAFDLGPTGRDDFFGWGLVNAAAAVGVPGQNRMRAFTGTASGGSISRTSTFALVSDTGSFRIDPAPAGTVSVFAWQDSNGNGVIDGGDYYGRADGVVVPPNGNVSGVFLTARLYTSPPVTLAASGRETPGTPHGALAFLAVLAAAVLGARGSTQRPRNGGARPEQTCVIPSAVRHGADRTDPLILHGVPQREYPVDPVLYRADTYQRARKKR